MLRKLLRKMNPPTPKSGAESTTNNNTIPKAISKNIDENLQYVKELLANNSDINLREFLMGEKTGGKTVRAFILSIEGISDKKVIQNHILTKLMYETHKISPEFAYTMENIKNFALSIDDVAAVDQMDIAVNSLFEGYTILFVDGEHTVLKISTKGWEHRGVEIPQTENVIRGPHEGFSETLRVNTALVRRKIKNPALKIEAMKIGEQTQTDVAIVYIAGIAEEKIVQEVRSRLSAIKMDAILESGYIEDCICDAPWSVFPTVGNTEIPDKFAAKILEGRVGILVDGTPIALTVPLLFLEGIQSQEDYYSRPFLASFTRIIRFVALHMTLFLPALYVAVIGFAPNVIPPKLMNSVLGNRSGVPLPIPIEATFMLLVWEILREAGVRIPKPSGQALSIVGALVIGELSVTSGLVAPILVIVTAATGLMGYLYISQINSIALLRFPILFMASTLGMLGFFAAYVFILIHLASLRSFGVPYLAPMAPLNVKDMKDIFIRVPWNFMKTRPRTIGWNNRVRAVTNTSEKNQRNVGTDQNES